jgi:hypothetical protein
MCDAFALTCRVLMLLGLPSFVAIPMPLWHFRQLLFWFLSVQLRSDAQHVCADLPRFDAVRLSEFVAFPTPLWHIRQ